jgi:hypothetical protein
VGVDDWIVKVRGRVQPCWGGRRPVMVVRVLALLFVFVGDWVIDGYGCVPKSTIWVFGRSGGGLGSVRGYSVGSLRFDWLPS